MPQVFPSSSPEETREIGHELAQKFSPGMIIAFEGELGAGKTTLIQGMLEALGAEKPYVSPTFVLMKQYDLAAPTPSGIRRIYHADAYRVGAKDFQNLGFAEWLTDKEGVVFLEWPERVAGILPEKYASINLESKSETVREIAFLEM